VIITSIIFISGLINLKEINANLMVRKMKLTSIRPLFILLSQVGFYKKRSDMPTGVYKRTKQQGKKHSKKLKQMYRNGELEVWNKNLTKETDERIAAYGKKSGQSRKGIKFSKNWRNNIGKTHVKDFEDVTIGNKHRKIEAKYGKANYCELNKTHKSKRFHWANINHKYNKNINEWIQLCDSCHKLSHSGKIDIKIIKRAIKNRK